MCYHIWTVADGGNAMFRMKRCFKAKSTADTTVKRGSAGERGSQHLNTETKSMVSKCHTGCPCGPGRKEHNNWRDANGN